MYVQISGEAPRRVRSRAAGQLGLAALCLGLLLLGTQQSPAPASPTILVAPVPTNGIAAMPVQFNAAADAQPGNIVITNYVWNFGDGSPLVTNI